MADKIDLLLEAERRGILPPAKAPLLEEARRRGLVKSDSSPARAQMQKSQTQDAPVEGPSALYRFAKGMKDPIDAGAQMLTRVLPDSVIKAGNTVGEAIGLDPMTSQDIDRDITQSNQQYESDRQAGGQTGMDIARLGGNIATTLPLAARLPVAGTMMGKVGSGVLGGGIFGALAPVTDPEEQKDFWTNKAQQAGISAGVAGPISAATGLLGKTLAPEVDKSVQYLMDKGVIPTMGQIKGGMLGAVENKLTSVPLLGDMIKNAQRRSVEGFNKATLNEVLSPINKTVDKIGREGVEETETLISDAYQAVMPKLQYQADQTFKAELANIMQMAKELPDPQFKQFASIIKNKLAARMSQAGTMDGQTFKGVESELTNLIKGYGKDPSFDQRQLGSAISAIRDALRQNLTRANPQAAPELAKANEAWARYARVRDAASRTTSDSGVFTPAQLNSAVRAGDQSIGKGKFAKGDALLQDLAQAGKDVITTYPDSGTAGRMVTGGLGLGGVGLVDPTSAAVTGALTLPYTQIGQKAMASLLTKRPQSVRNAGQLLSRVAPAIGGVGGLLGGLLAN